MEASIEQGVAWQIRINRKKRNLSQDDLAELIGTNQSAISRIEDPEYGKHSLDTLVSVANAFDCALSVKFIPYSKLAEDSEDLGADALYAAPFTEECHQQGVYLE
ncbi:MAG TPA: helix-turn-helix transcriptional regulator [Burkholderiaceae bacterium]|nr:helix-turn-helix transcriptional regulator [Burkholderiaceae bacterium]